MERIIILSKSVIIAPMLEFLTSSPMPELLLLLGGLIGVAIAFLGDKKGMWIDNVARILGFFVGAVLIAMALAMLIDKVGATSTWAIALLLGIALFFKIFKKVPVALLVALLLAAVVGFLLYTINADTIVILIAVVVVVLLVYVLVRIVEAVADFIGRVLGLRPVLFILGLVAMIEAALLFMGNSISGLL